MEKLDLIEMPCSEIAGSDEVVGWFGYWPSFHDAEVLELRLIRKGTSRLTVFSWNTTNELFERDGKQYFVQDKHAVVTFLLEGIVDLSLEGFNHQNVVSGIYLVREQDHLRLIMEDCYGISGHIDTTRIAVSVSPGPPDLT